MAKRLTYEELEERVATLEKENLQLRKEANQLEEKLGRGEEKYRIVADFTHDWEMWISPSGYYLYVSPSCERITGYLAEEFITDSSLFRHILHPDDLAQVEKHHRDETEGSDQIYSIDFRIINRRGEERWINHYCQPVYGHDMCFLGRRVSNRDITERKRMEDELRKSEERYRRVLEDQTEVICRFREDGTFTFVNEVYCRFFAKQPQELIGKKWQPLIVAEDMPLIEAKLRSLSPSNPVVLVENRVYSGDKQVRWMQFVNRGFFGTKGRLIEIQSVGRDITKNKELESQLFQAQKMESLGILVAGLSHEINNPVNTIMVNAPLFRKVWEDLLPILHECAERDPCRKYGGLTADFLAENMGQLISDVDRASDRISRIIQGLKDFARKTGQDEPKLVSLDDCAANALRLVESTARKSGITLSFEAMKDLPAIKGDPMHIEQIILNLLLNAVQAITHDHGEISVITGIRKDRRRVFISVADNGNGIDPGTKNKVFDPFFTTRQTEGGTGLGLAVTHNLVEAHGGEIRYESVKGRGTTFTVMFPTA
jgi:PAS domain S-box-containing protein